MSVLRNHDLANLDRELQTALGVLVEPFGFGPCTFEEWLQCMQLNDPSVSEDTLRRCSHELIAEGYVRRFWASGAIQKHIFQATNAGMDAAIGYGCPKLVPAEPRTADPERSEDCSSRQIVDVNGEGGSVTVNHGLKLVK